MKLLLVGDIVGRPGKHACSQVIPRLVRDRQIDFVVANAENASAGSGLTPSMFKKLQHYGVDVCTMGDHIYRRRDILPLLSSSDRVVRPINLPPEAAGREVALVTARDGTRVAVLSVLGRIFMNVRSDCPYHAVDRVLKQIPMDVRVIVVDMHAEATSEKVAMGWHLDGRVSVVAGTHTHVQTSDERVLPKGTAYITDLGMTGPHESVLGRDRGAVLRSLITGMPHPYNVAEGDRKLHGVIVEVDPSTGRAVSIERVCESDPDDGALPEGDDD